LKLEYITSCLKVNSQGNTAVSTERHI